MRSEADFALPACMARGTILVAGSVSPALGVADVLKANCAPDAAGEGIDGGMVLAPGVVGGVFVGELTLRRRLCARCISANVIFSDVTVTPPPSPALARSELWPALGAPRGAPTAAGDGPSGGLGRTRGVVWVRAGVALGGVWEATTTRAACCGGAGDGDAVFAMGSSDGPPLASPETEPVGLVPSGRLACALVPARSGTQLCGLRVEAALGRMEPPAPETLCRPMCGAGVLEPPSWPTGPVVLDSVPAPDRLAPERALSERSSVLLEPRCHALFSPWELPGTVAAGLPAERPFGAAMIPR